MATTKKKSAPKKVVAKKTAVKKTRRPLPKALRIIFTPAIAFGRYVKGAWIELRQVRWPNRKATWSLVLAVIVYSIFFLILIVLLDTLFKYLFEQLIQ